MAPSSHYILPVVLLCMCGIAAGRKGEAAQASNAAKIAQMEEWVSRRSIVRLDMDKFKNYVRSSKNYSVMVMLTALKPQRGCSVCGPANDEYQIVANSWHYSTARTTQLYFAMVEYDDAGDIFSSLNLNSAPAFILFPPKGKPRKEDTFEVHRHGYEAEAIAKWLSERTDITIRVMRPPNYMLTVTLLLSVAMVAGLAYVKRDSLDFIYNKNMWGVLTVSFILLMMSGQMWNQIRGPPFAHKDPRSGAIHYIHGSSQGQFVAETYIVMLLHGAVTTGLIFMNETPTLKVGGTPKKVFAVIGLATVAFFFSLLLSVFKSKYQGYPYRFLL